MLFLGHSEISIHGSLGALSAQRDLVKSGKSDIVRDIDGISISNN